MHSVIERSVIFGSSMLTCAGCGYSLLMDRCACVSFQQQKPQPSDLEGSLGVSYKCTPAPYVEIPP